MRVYRWAYRALRSATLPYHFLLGPLSIGVRGMVLDPRRGVLLVKHSYLPGWHFPGGGLKRGETVYEAMRRELMEETGVISQGGEELFAIYRNPAERRQDHVCLFVIRSTSGARERTASRLEIVDSRYFELSDLPPDTSPATRRRIEEVSAGRAFSHEW